MVSATGELDGVPRAGDVIAGKYVVEHVLGVGGMGAVVAARHAHLGQRVALKFLLPQAAKDRDAVVRFLREARAAVSIQSEHVARVTDVGTLETGVPYMVMEYLIGTDLAAVVRRGPLPIQVALDHVLQASEALAEAHSLGIVHRDLKPANLFLTTRADGTSLVKVIDFGISKMAILGGHAGAGDITTTSAVMGSPLYMSPEQAKSTKNVDARTDIWALGVIIYELLAGRTPFEAETLVMILAKILTEAPPSLVAVRPDVPVELANVIAGCLEKDPARRPRDMASFAQAIAPFAAPASRISIDRIVRIGAAAIWSESTADVMGATQGAPSDGSAAPPPAATPQASSATDASWGTTQAPSKSRRMGLLLAGGGIGAGVAFALGLTLFAGSKSVPAPGGSESATPGAADASPAPAARTVRAPDGPAAATSGPGASSAAQSSTAPAGSGLNPSRSARGGMTSLPRPKAAPVLPTQPPAQSSPPVRDPAADPD